MKHIQGAACVLLAIGLGGCATLLESNQQELMVQAIEDNKELVNVGCVLSNSAGRWFVTAPGRVMVTKSNGDMKVDCKKADVSSGGDTLVSKLNNVGLWGNVVLTAGLGYLVDKRTGSGFEYPPTVTVIMRRTPQPVVVTPPGGNVVY
jgi:hypothetical protein